MLYAGLLSVSLSLFLSLTLALALSPQQCMNLLRDLYLGIMILTDGFMYVLLGQSYLTYIYIYIRINIYDVIYCVYAILYFIILFSILLFCIMLY